MLQLTRKKLMAAHFEQALSKIFSSRYLLLTNTLTTSALLGAADALQQRINGDWDPSKDKPFDKLRTLRFSIMGFVMGPMNHFWYKMLDRVAFKGSKGVVVAKKVVCDTLSSPLFASTFISGVAILEGNSVKIALEEYRRKFFRIARLDVSVWPPAQTLNFYFLPSSYRVIYVAFVQLVYNCCLSYIKHNEADGSKTRVILDR